MTTTRVRLGRLPKVVLVAAAAAVHAGCGSRPPSPVERELGPFLESYFDTWSRGDMKAYGEHFHPLAVVSPLRDGILAPWTARDRFVDQQRSIRERDGGRSVERMLSFVADGDASAATAVAVWELTRGAGVDRQISRGVDRFTLARDENARWKIVSLVFYTTE